MEQADNTQANIAEETSCGGGYHIAQRCPRVGSTRVSGRVGSKIL